METITFTLGEERSDFKSNITVSKYEKNPIYYSRYFLNYPCEKTYDCTFYQAYFPRGLYKFTLCGGNGGVLNSAQETGFKNDDFPYAAGCTSGIIKLKARTKMYVYIGGHGDDVKNSNSRSNGGFNGGGSGNYVKTRSTGGGGASDVRAEVDDVFHRIIVAGGGGGGDSPTEKIVENDGCGGSGGGYTAQGWYTSSKTVDNSLAANQTFGFSFGQGEAGKSGGSNNPKGSKFSEYDEDFGGAGGGWFGGFASHHDAYGAGGGSSFILTQNASIPDVTLTKSDEFYNNRVNERYAFIDNRKYIFTNPVLKRGVWFGNGFAEIIHYANHFIKCKEVVALNSRSFAAMIILLVK